MECKVSYNAGYAIEEAEGNYYITMMLVTKRLYGKQNHRVFFLIFGKFPPLFLHQRKKYSQRKLSKHKKNSENLLKNKIFRFCCVQLWFKEQGTRVSSEINSV